MRELRLGALAGERLRATLQRSALSTRHAVLATATAMALFAAACASGPAAAPTARSPSGGPPPAPLTPAPNVPGNPENGRQLFVAKGCIGCHTLRGVPAATGVVGPNLTNVALRPTLAGETIENSPQNMARWILDPPSLKPGTAMPRLGLAEQEARNLVAFLYSQPYNPAH
ncbi:MAG: c-type cytochrome [Chloroflexi bacterium]|nr:c-type cytochrome [Chloroflexota bacterium]